MKPAVAAVVAKVRADGSWPDLLTFASMLRTAGGTGAEVMSVTRSYRAALFSGHWPDELTPTTAEDELLALLHAFSLPT